MAGGRGSAIPHGPGAEQGSYELGKLLWQVELEEGWAPIGEEAAVAIGKACDHRKGVAAYEARGFVYLIDFETRTQVNTNTGRWRRIRPAPAAGQEAPCAGEEIQGSASKRARRDPSVALPASTLTPPVATPVEPAAAAAPSSAAMPPPAPRAATAPVAAAAPRVAAAPAAPAPVAPAPAAAAAPVPAAPAGRVPVGGEGNSLLADIFEEMATIQKLKRDRFRARAYDKASQAIRAHPEAIVSGAMAKAIEGVGAGMARRIDIVLATGELEELKELKRDSDVVALRELRSVHGIGAVRAAELIERGVRSLEDLRAAVAAGNVRLDPVQSIGLRLADEFRPRIPRAEAREHEALLLDVRSRRHPELWLQVCGSYRRGKPDCGDIDVLISHPRFTALHREANAGGALLRGFIQSLREESYLTDDLAAGTTKYMGACRLPGPSRFHRRIDVRCLPSDQFHFGTLYFTGSASLSIRLRLRAIELGMRLSEYSLERKDTGEKVQANSEREIFEALGMTYLEPHER